MFGSTDNAIAFARKRPGQARSSRKAESQPDNAIFPQASRQPNRIIESTG